MSQSKNVNALRRRERKDIKRLEKQVGGGTVVQSSGGGGAYVHPNHSGDVTSVGDGAQTIVADAVITVKILDDNVTNAKLANMLQSTIKGRAVNASTGDPTDLTPSQARAVLELDGSTQSQIMKFISFRA